MKLSDVYEAAKHYIQSGFIADVHPGCANFVSHCIKKAGGNMGIINYVPTIVDKCKKVGLEQSTGKVPGMLIVFERTYDAVAPAGIGKEDDMTHIGVYAGGEEFYDYGGKPAMVRKKVLNCWWLERVQFYLIPPGVEGTGSNSTEIPNSSNAKTAKLFVNKNGKTLILEGKKEEVHQLGFYATGKNDSIVIDCNFLNTLPAMETRKGSKARVLSMEVIVKYEEV